MVTERFTPCDSSYKALQDYKVGQIKWGGTKYTVLIIIF